MAEPGDDAAAAAAAASAAGDATDDAAVSGGEDDAARAALNRARAAARARGHSSGTPARGGRGAQGTSRSGAAAPSTAGAGPDARDPQRVQGSIGRLVAERGWSQPVAIGGVMGRWPQVVGPALAEHCTPERFEDGVLEVRAGSTAWATQVRLLAPVVLRRLGEELGPGVVQRVVVRGPVAPTWHRGSRSTSDGRGPRDTYG